jgi:hypothetical protein
VHTFVESFRTVHPLNAGGNSPIYVGESPEGVCYSCDVRRRFLRHADCPPQREYFVSPLVELCAHTHRCAPAFFSRLYRELAGL